MAVTPQQPTGSVAGNDDLFWSWGVVFRAYVRTTAAVAADLPGGPRALQVLSAAARDEAGSQSTLAARLGIDRTVMTYLLDDLVRAGLVERRPDPADRRNRRVVITDRGRGVLSDLESRLAHAEEHLLEGLDADERDALRGMVGRLARRVADFDPADLDTCRVVRDIAAVAEGTPPGD